jgi:hypothetical protein
MEGMAEAQLPSDSLGSPPASPDLYEPAVSQQAIEKAEMTKLLIENHYKQLIKSGTERRAR